MKLQPEGLEGARCLKSWSKARARPAAAGVTVPWAWGWGGGRSRTDETGEAGSGHGAWNTVGRSVDFTKDGRAVTKGF